MISKEEAKKKIASLVERFEEQKEFYKRSNYNETLTQQDFINPFFKALGWDIDNEQGYAESYREVIHEDKIKIGGATKAPSKPAIIIKIYSNNFMLPTRSTIRDCLILAEITSAVNLPLTTSLSKASLPICIILPALMSSR